MQLFAKSLEGEVVSAKFAYKRESYICLECRKEVRVREGLHRRPHFFHLDENRLCKQAGKSKTHLEVQLYIKEKLLDEAELEVPFVEINRIADVFWEKEKLVFEVQCSFITREEVEARNSDYEKLGIKVIWILHDRRYNQWSLSAAERFLKGKPHYFTSIKEDGKGIIYDQWSFVEKGVRIDKMKQLPIDLRKPLRDEMSSLIGFSGDFASLKMAEHDAFAYYYVKEVEEREKDYLERSLQKIDFKEKVEATILAIGEFLDDCFRKILMKYSD